MAAVSSQRYHGRNGKLFVSGPGGTVVPSPIPFAASFEIDMSTDKQDVTAFGDSNHAYVVGLPDDKGSWSGFSDLAGDTLYTATRDGLSRKFYFYPDYVNAVGTYYFGSAFFDIKSTFEVASGAKVSGNWVAASDISRVLQS